MYETPVAKERKATTERNVQIAKVLDDMTTEMNTIATRFGKLRLVRYASERAAEFEAKAVKGKS